MSESKYNVENVNLPYYEQTKNYPKIKINFNFFVAGVLFEEVWKVPVMKENVKRNHKR